MVDLTQIKLATEEDKEYQIDYWATLFKSKTWEEMKMLAEKDARLEEKDVTIEQLQRKLKELEMQLENQ